MIWLRLAMAFAKAGLFTFGSGYAMLTLLEREIVGAHQWLTPEQFADVVALSEVTPGPITVNLATFVGYRIAGIIGSVFATLGLIIGPMVIMLLVVRYYGEYRDHPSVEAAFRGLRPVVVALIALAVLNLGQVAFVDFRSVMLFASVLGVAYFTSVSPILLVVAGVLVGIFFMR